MTQSPVEIFKQLGLNSEIMNLKGLHFGEFPEGTKVVAKGTPVFPRLEIETEVAYIQKKMAEGSSNVAQTIKWDPEETELVSVKDKEIKYEDFDKVELKLHYHF